MNSHLITPGLIAISLLCSACANEGQLPASELTPKQQLGKQLFFDTNLSSPEGQSCSSCHLPSAGFADPDSEIPVSRGVDPADFGNRNAPSAAYAAFSPEFHFDEDEGIYFGGQFVDGRAHTLEDQARAPFLNPLEMGNIDETSVVEKVSQASYAPLFKQIYGIDIFTDVESAYDSIADAIAEFERSAEVNRFSSKFDAVMQGRADFTAQEQRGFEVFTRADKGNCAACHPVTSEDPEIPPLLTDFSYDNLGVPANPDNPFLLDNPGFVDLGLGGELAQVAENGKFKVPTLRNIAVTAPYMHNGVFDTLEEVVNFYNSRDADGIVPEVADNVNMAELGNLGLSNDEMTDLVVFMQTLTDGYDTASE
jgi:cytochrome c peroxidase